MTWIAEFMTRSPSRDSRLRLESAEAICTGAVPLKVVNADSFGKRYGLPARAMMRPAVTGPWPKMVVSVECGAAGHELPEDRVELIE